MGSKKKKLRKANLLSHTRPLTQHPHKSLSSKATRTLVRTHHTLHKQLTQALQSNNHDLAASLHSQIEALGGLQTYQQASMQGQSTERGGDSSKMLMEWLSDLWSSQRTLAYARSSDMQTKKYRLLEVGALSPHNACSRSNVFEVERIDLHSQHSGIVKQDFMLRPVPTEVQLQDEGFDMLSLSLVVNFVPEAIARGEMLRRAAEFLRKSVPSDEDCKDAVYFPGLFLVLPLSCVENSRYLDEKRLDAIMENLGYVQVRMKKSKKLVYYLWRYRGRNDKKEKTFGKEEIRKGGGRNNFAIVLK